MTIISEKCKRCKYLKKLTLLHMEIIDYCDYLCMTGKRRGCEAGECCNKFELKG